MEVSLSVKETFPERETPKRPRQQRRLRQPQLTESHEPKKEDPEFRVYTDDGKSVGRSSIALPLEVGHYDLQSRTLGFISPNPTETLTTTLDYDVDLRL